MTFFAGALTGSSSGAYRTFASGEYDLNCSVDLDPPGIPSLSDYALWSLYSNRSDALGNFDNLVLCGDDEDVAFLFYSFYFDGHHWLETPSGVAGMDLEGILKVDGLDSSPDASYSFSIHFLLDSLPSPGTYRWIIFSGDLESHLGVRVLSDGRIQYVRVHGLESSSVESDPCEVNRWHSLSVLHDGAEPARCNLIVDGVSYDASPAVPIVAGDPSSGDSTPISLGKGIAYDFYSMPCTWDSNTAHPKFSFSSDSLLASSDTTYSYGSCGGTGVMDSSSMWYWELEFLSGDYLWFGLADRGADFSLSAALIGWVVACHNGRIWDHETGGGCDWGPPIPLGARIGLAYNGVGGELWILVNGQNYGVLPFTISGDVVPVICSNGESSVLLYEDPDLWMYAPPSGLYNRLPSSLNVTETGEAPLYRGRMRLFRARKEYPSESEYSGPDSLEQVNLLPHFYAVDPDGVEYSLDGSVYKWYESDGYVGIKTPNIPSGFYRIYAEFRSSDSLITKEVRRVNIRNGLDVFPYSSLTFALPDDEIRSFYLWDVCNKAWGSDNGGCSARLVSIGSQALMRAHGDLYDGYRTYGVDRLGNPTGRKTRVGSCLVTRQYFLPGRFDFWVTVPPDTGACSAVWGFHYEEAYPGDNLWRELLNDGLHRSGDAELGKWIVRNHEIDIETPTALKSDPDHEVVSYFNGRFNSWRGELRNWDVEETDPEYWSEYVDEWLPFPLGNISEHESAKLSIIWKTDPPSVEFLTNDVHVTTITESVPTIPMKWWIGIWFPSASVKWAGASADWYDTYFQLHRFEYSRIDGQPVHLASESYPTVGIRPLSLSNLNWWW